MILSSSNLKKAIKPISAIESKTTLLDFKSGTIVSLDMGLGAVVSLPDLRGSLPSVSINSRLFNSTISKLTKDITINVEGNVLVIKSAKFKAELPILADNISFPEVPKPDFYLSLKTFRELSSFAQSVTDESMQADHTGLVKYTVVDGKSEAIGTDNLRIAIGKSTSTDKDISIVLPSRILKLIKDIDKETIGVSDSPTILFLQSDAITVFVRKTVKKFPEVHKVVPKDFILEVKVPLEDFKEVVNRLSPILSEENLFKILLDFQDGSFIISSTSGGGRMEDSIEIEQISPDPFLDEPVKLRLAVNGKHLSQFLSIAKEKYVTIKANDQGKPFMLEAGSKKLLLAGMKL